MFGMEILMYAQPYEPLRVVSEFDQQRWMALLLRQPDRPAGA